ncbi:MAG: WD40/YVTN/BNR-like repeat-containing protein, partial [Acidobacteriota bacterium]
MTRARLSIFVVLVCLLFPITPEAQQAQPADQKNDNQPFKGLKYRNIGPAQGGRVSRVAGVPGEPSVYYAATASGGVWKSTDGGITFKPIFDSQPIASIGSIAVAPSDPNIIYVGSGEANIRGNVAPGNGIYKSTDAGKTWTQVWKQEGQIGTMIVHPRNPDIAFAAVLGHAFGPNAERGVYRTKDGGKSWQQVLKKDSDTGASDVAMDPSNPNMVFAGFWQARRKPWDLVSGGPGGGLYVSRDGGDTWKQLKGDGLPEGIWGKVGVAVAPSDGSRVYALIEAEKGGLFRSDDGGESWTLATADRALRQRAWYYTTMTVNPMNEDDVWFPQVPLLRTIDGGKTIKYIKGPHHGDYHDAWIDPRNPKRMIVANDGGVDISIDGGETWYAPALPIGQFYHVSADTRVPYRVAGAQQDLGTAQGPSNSLTVDGITAAEWYSVGGGEAGHVVSDSSDPNIVYAGEYLGYLSRYDHRTRQARNVSAYPENASGHGGADFKYRFQWTAPIATSPHDPKVVYHGANVLFKTTDGGQSWTAISPDLTRDDKAKEQWAGGPITGDNTGVETYCTIFAIAESPREKGVIWVGSDDGLVHV